MRLPLLQDSNERPDICGPCGGKCCKNMPGTSYPSDWGQTREEIAANVFEALCSGKWAIDWWDGDVIANPDSLDNWTGRSLYLRPAVATEEGTVFDASSVGRCIFHTDEGCSIPDERPTGCRALVPGEDEEDECYYPVEEDEHDVGDNIRKIGTNYDAAKAWYDLQDILEKAGNKAQEVLDAEFSTKKDLVITCGSMP